MSLPKDQSISSVSVTAGAPRQNNEDPTGQFPRTSHFFSPNINYSATGGKRNELYLGGGDVDVDLGLTPPIASVYPYNQVQETVSGHVIEVDDTPGNERVLIKHASGIGLDLRHDGSVVIVSKKNKIDITGDDQIVIVEGEGTLVYKGNLNLKVSGDFNVDVGGNYNVKVAGNRNENIIGSDRKTVNGNVGQIIRGGYSTTVTQQVTDTFLAGHSHNVKGTFSNNVEGAANYVSSGDVAFTSETRINMSTQDLNIAGTSTSVFGATGTFGGAGVVFYGKGGTFSEGVTAPTFKGNLDGKADEAALADKALGANTAGSIGSSGTASYPSHVATPTTALPNGTNILEYLSKAAGGIRKVTIDVGNYIKNFIDKTEAYNGVATFEQTLTTARSRLKDPANRNNSAFVAALVSENIVSTDVLKPTPNGIGRIISGNSTPKFGQTPIGLRYGTSTTDPFLPIAGKASILPDPYFNPLNQTTITSSTKLAPGVRLAKFLGSAGDPVTIDFIQSQDDRKTIAKHLYYHATIVQSLLDNRGAFANLRLVVAEGLYKPGPSEKITPNSINDLRSKGRAIVYELYNINGGLALQETFDLAEYWKDTIFFDKLILNYDTYHPSKKLHAQIIVTIPELDANWEAVFNREVETVFNGTTMTQGNLVEVLSENPNSQSYPSATSSLSSLSGETYTGGLSGKIDRVDPRLLSLIENAGLVTGLTPYVTSGYRGPPNNPSGRHAGFAVDIQLYRNGKLLSVTNTADSYLIQSFTQEFVSSARSNGFVPSVGIANPGVNPLTGRAYPLYMNGTAFHYDIALTPGIGAPVGSGATTYWGGSGETKDVPAPAWLAAIV